MGTSGVVFAHADAARLRPAGPAPARLPRRAGRLARDGRRALGRRQLPVVPQRAGQGRGRRWPRQKGEDPYFLLTDEAALAGPGAEGLFFLPYLTGERTPHFDPDAKGAWIGLTVRHGRAHMIRSVLEGATFAMRDSLELIREMGVTIEQVRVSGGGARNALWRQIQADIYGCDVHTLNSTEGPAFGVALLAQVGTGGVHLGPRGVRRHDPVRRLDRASTPRPRRFTTAPTPSIASSTSIFASSFKTIGKLVSEG